MADWNTPSLSTGYATFLSGLTSRDLDVATQFNNGTPTNTPTGAIKWNSALGRWQIWSGTAWNELAATYNLTGVTCTSFNNTGNTTLGDAAADTVTSNAASWSFVNATTVTGSLTFSGTVNFSGTLQSGGAAVLTAASTATLTNKTFDTAGTGNALKVNGNSLTAAAGTATITFPNSTDTLVGRATTDTLTNKTLTSPVVNGGTISAANINADAAITDTNTISAASPGFRGLPVAGGAAKTANYTLALTDAGKDVQMNATGLTLTIPANASVAFPIGTTLMVSNLFAGPLTLAITSDTLYIAGTTTGGAGISRTIAQNGQVTITKKTATVWWVNGSGLS